MHKFLIAAAAAVAALSAAVAVAQTGQGQGGGRFAAMFAMADANHDGTITRAEFDAARAARFLQMDADHNGSLSAAESPRWGSGQAQPTAAGGPEHVRGDANGDGSVSRAEWDAESTRMFSRLDTDNNGAISQAELQAVQQRVQQH
jgi:Ca2+-binding EF-hand superfamily protein